MRRSLSRSVYRAALMADAIGRSLDHHNPSACLFLTHRAMLNELLSTRRHKMQRIFLLQGVVPEVPPVSLKLEVELAIVGSELEVPYLRRCGVSDERTAIVGYPDYDHFPQLTREACRGQLVAAMEALHERPLVVFTSQYPTGQFPDWARTVNLEAVFAAARKLPHVTFLIKTHPRREVIDALVLARFPENVLLAPKVETPSLLKAADVVVTYWSTTALEALLLDVPLVQLNATGLPDFFDLVSSLGRSFARSSDELADSLQLLLESEEARTIDARARAELCARLGVVMDGRAGERAGAAIEKIRLNSRA
jgi:hypothetical protein